MTWLDELRFDPNGLIPVVAQEASTGEVLMVAYADREALEHTVSTGYAHYHSRSRGSLWKKGETSGHTQHVLDVRVDCDGDAVLYRVRQTGPACHTLARTCFFRAEEEGALVEVGPGGHVLTRLDEIVRDRHATRPEGSYTTYLFDKGVDKILKKVGEEATEVVVAAKNGAPEELRAETADLIFHLAVLLRAQGLPIGEVWDELENRFGRPPRVPAGAEVDRSS